MRRSIRNAEVGECETGGDLAYYLMENERNRKAGTGAAAKEWNLAWLTGNSLLAIVAGRYSSPLVCLPLLLHCFHVSKQASRLKRLP